LLSANGQQLDLTTRKLLGPTRLVQESPDARCPLITNVEAPPPAFRTIQVFVTLPVQSARIAKSTSPPDTLQAVATASTAIYRAEVSAARRGTVTLVYSSHDTQHNNAVALQEYVQTKLRRPATSKRAVAADRPRGDR